MLGGLKSLARVGVKKRFFQNRIFHDSQNRNTNNTVDGRKKAQAQNQSREKLWKESARARGGLRKISDLHEAPHLSVQISKTAANAIINGAIAI